MLWETLCIRTDHRYADPCDRQAIEAMNFKTQKLFGLPPGVDFPKALVDGFCAHFQSYPPDAMARSHIIVNTERMRRRVWQLFATKSDILHPKVHVLTDLSGFVTDLELPQAPSSLKNRFELIALIDKLLQSQPDLAARSALFDLADSLASLIDEMQGEAVDPAAISALNVSDQSGHWQRMQAFLTIAQTYLDARQTEPDKESLQRTIVTHLAEKWATDPISEPVVIAGSTGSRGTTLELMKAIANLPQGALLLPGFDFDMPLPAWDDLSDAMSGEDHPQYRFYKLLGVLDKTPDQVEHWHKAKPQANPRTALISLALRPAPVTDVWLAEGPKITDLGKATEKMTLVEAPSARQEAVAIALRLRQAAEEGQTAALITPDRQLTRQVSAALSRWDILPDDSAGIPLPVTPPGRLLRQVAGLLKEQLKTVQLLALLKHPLTHSGNARGDHLLLTRELELHLRAKAIPFPDAETLISWADTQPHRMVKDWAQWLIHCFIEQHHHDQNDFSVFFNQHISLAESIAAGCQPETEVEKSGLWAKKAGQEAYSVVQDIQSAADHAGVMSVQDYGHIFNGVLNQREVRDYDMPHPNLLIWGTLEARVQGADLVILGGLNETSWPKAPNPDPWLNRSMRNAVGLLMPERRIGLSAHDFQQAVAAPEVWITRSTRSDDAETVPSRWLNRLMNLLSGLQATGGPKALRAMQKRGEKYLAMVAEFEACKPMEPANRPAPRPPIAARPTQLSVTEIKSLIRDPYAIYAKRVLNLRPLAPLEQSADAKLRGNIAHRVMENFIRDWEKNPSKDQKQRFLELSQTILGEQVPWVVSRLFWQWRIQKVADPLIARETHRQQTAEPVAFERRGRLPIDGLNFTLTAIADRIDRAEDGSLQIYDYKTGTPPTADQQKVFDKQLYLMAAIAERGGFESIDPAPVDIAAFIGIGGQYKEQSAPFKDEPLESAWDKFKTLIASYQNTEQGYSARRALFSVKDFSDYDQLSRFGEWDLSDAPVPEDLT